MRPRVSPNERAFKLGRERLQVKTMLFPFLLLPLLSFFLSGCTAMFPSGTTTTVSRWRSFDEARTDFEKVVPRQTTVADLKTLGFDPYVTPNVKILTYLDLQNRFLVNPSIRREDLPASIRECLDAKDRTHAYELDLNALQTQRHGNLFLDMTGFRKKTQETGWCFKALIVLQDDVVVYKLWSGEPHMKRTLGTKKPLGPFQDVESLISGLPRTAF